MGNTICNETSERKNKNQSNTNTNNNIANNDLNTSFILKNNPQKSDINKINNNTSNNNNQNSKADKSIEAYNIKDNKRFVFNGSKSYNLIVHRNDGMNDFIIEMTLTKYDKNNINKKAEFIMILDVSGSMRGHVHKLVSDIIPRGLNLLNYSENHIIHLITFESYVKYYRKTISELKNDYSLEGAGGTEMANVYEKVREILNNNSNGNNFRILVLSDGIIADQEKTVNEAEKINQFIKNNNYSISVGSIRYNSGYGQPDTRAISSVLRL